MKTISAQSFIVLSLSLLKGIGATFIKKNLVTINNNHGYWLTNDYIQSLNQLLKLLGKKYAPEEIEESVIKTEDILSECELHKIDLISLVDHNYPKTLLDLKDPPPVLFYLGNFSLLKEDVITIIGTRKPNKIGQRIAERIAKHFVTKGWVVCNGLADGIDTFSIQEQNEYFFRKVVGVVGSGLAKSSFRSLPKQSLANIESVLQNDGLVISEMPPLKKQDTFSVVKSCRIQAGLGNGLVLIQSSIAGGSRFTVKAAVEANRPLGVVYPWKTDIHSDDYSANRIIIENGIKGLNEFVGLKNSNICNYKIVVISSKESYPEFESVLIPNQKLLTINTEIW